jgi:hypothetical protein
LLFQSKKYQSPGNRRDFLFVSTPSNFYYF